jgi:anti-anti-sigma factor
MASDLPVLIPPVELTSGTIAEFDGRARRYLAERVPALVIDLSPVTFLSSSGLGRLVDLGRRMHEQGGQVLLAAGSRAVVRLIRLVGLDQVMPHFPSVVEAATYFAARQAPPP